MGTLGHGIPICGVMGDQQAALFGQACFEEGDAKATYGTGLFMLVPTGRRPVFSESGLLTTVGASFAGKTTYAIEGSIFHAGSGVQWLRDEMGLIENAAESERLARMAESTQGVYFVPAFTGLGAPYWDPAARGLIAGISRGTRREHIVRAVLESIAYGARDLADCISKDSGAPLRRVKCDGGASANDFLMQFQSDASPWTGRRSGSPRHWAPPTCARSRSGSRTKHSSPHAEGPSTSSPLPPTAIHMKTSTRAIKTRSPVP